MNDNDLFALIWKLATVVLCILITSVAGSNGMQRYQISKSNTPLEIACAMGNNDNACIAIRSK